jgi:hypothetical protein
MPHDRHRRLRIAADAQTRTPQLATCQHHCLASVELICAVPCVSRRPNDGFGIRSPKFPQRSPSTGRHGGAVTLSGQAGGVCSLVQWPSEGEPLLERCASPASPPEIPRPRMGHTSSRYRHDALGELRAPPQHIPAHSNICARALDTGSLLAASHADCPHSLACHRMLSGRIFET